MTTRRNTKQKSLILSYLQTHPIHPTAEKVYQELQPSIPNLTLATVYRNLHLLTEEKQILTLNVNKEFHFDATTEPHLHLICQKCNHITDIMIKNIHQKCEEIFKLNNFTPTTTSYLSYGLCQKCQTTNSNK